jgi:aldehyde:ferredoxin oxidoreductase
VRNPEATNTDEPAKNLPTLAHYIRYVNATTGSNKKLEDILAESERLYILQKLINLRHGKGTRVSDQIPLRALGPAFLNEYQSRAEYYDKWLQEQLGGDHIPTSPEQRHELLIEKRIEAYQQLCDIVYEKKGFTSEGIPKRETVEKFALMDEQARQLIDEFGG